MLKPYTLTDWLGLLIMTMPLMLASVCIQVA